MSPVTRATLLVLFPVVAAGVGSATAAWRRPSPAVASGVQHFAAGVVFAALATEVLPDLRADGRLVITGIGFAVGVAALLGLGAVSSRLEAAAGQGATTAQRQRLPWPLLIAVLIDLLIDGLLVGLGATLGSTQALVLTAALTIEILFLGVSVCLELLDGGIPAAKAATTSGLLGLATAVGAIGGAAALGQASLDVRVFVLAFGAAALLYLVVEELLVEAHEQPETPLLAGTFFAGFLVIFLLAGIES